MEPLVFEPYLRPVVWGGRQLGELLGKRLPGPGAYGESWEISPHPVHVSRVAEGAYAGRSLTELCASSARAVFGTDGDAPQPFPLLIKLLDCRELLSIQVHPDDRLARQLAGEAFGKTEAWVVLQAQPGAAIYAGFLAGVTRRDVEQHLRTGTLDRLLHRFSPNPGDCLFLPAGTVHAVGGGVLMAEVQEASDATFRLYDWNRVDARGRARELHIEQALAAIDWNAGPVRPIPADVAPESAANVVRQPLVDCPHFRLERIGLHAAFDVGDQRGAEVWMVLAGQAVLQTVTGYDRRFQHGETVLIPAAAQAPRWTPLAGAATLLRVRLPTK